MKNIWFRLVLKWVALAVLVGIFAGLASALFLFSLDHATRFRESHMWIIWFLPFAGLVVGLLYHQWGARVEKGNNLLLEEIHNPQAVIPVRMTAMIFLGTVVTHLFGGSAGREGTAVQMGGSLADQLAKPFHLVPEERRMLLMVGMSAGFASVFGVPFAGTIFGVEVLGPGHFNFRAVVPCLMAAFIAHYTCLFCGIEHTLYSAPQIPDWSFTNALWLSVAASLFGCCAWLFARLTEELSHTFKRYVQYGPLRPAVGGLLVIAGFYALGNFRFAGLGIPILRESLQVPLPPWDWMGKMFFTILTLGSGFKGGEVTPLLFIGATLGNSLSAMIPLPFSLLAAVGFVAVFAGAANTPLACAVMGMEIFGPTSGVYMLLGCVVSYWCSGHGGIYSAQRSRGRHARRNRSG